MKAWDKRYSKQIQEEMFKREQEKIKDKVGEISEKSDDDAEVFAKLDEIKKMCDIEGPRNEVGADSIMSNDAELLENLIEILDNSHGEDHKVKEESLKILEHSHVV